MDNLNAKIESVTSELLGDYISSINQLLQQAIESNTEAKGDFSCYVDHQKSRWYFIGSEPILFVEEPKFKNEGAKVAIEYRVSMDKDFLKKNNPSTKSSHTTNT